MPMTTPTVSPTSITGAAIVTRTHIDSRARSSASPPFISFNLDGMASARRSDRHTHDVLIGGDHLVADGDNGFERDFRCLYGRDHVDEIALALNGAARLQFRGAPGIRCIAQHARQHV